MLIEIAADVWLRQSEFCQSNAVVVRGDDGLLLIDPGVDGDDLAGLADDVDALALPVRMGFATHPHWDHLLWHERFGDAPRYGTAACAAVAGDRLADAREKAGRLAPGAPLELLGRIDGLPPGTATLPWSGPAVRIVEHRAHAPGHAGLLVQDVLVAGDMLSDVEVPLLDLGATDPVGDYVAALALLTGAAAESSDLVPGHGAVAHGPAQIHARLEADRVYLQTLQTGVEPEDPRVGPKATYGRDWLPREHHEQVVHVLGRS